MNPFEKLFPIINDKALAPMDPERARLVAKARGDVLELGMGTGLNLGHYPGVKSITAIEPADVMRKKAEERAQELGLKVTFEIGFAEEMPFADETFDTVLSTFVLCSVRDIGKTVNEIKRVLKPGGQFLALEHVRSQAVSVAYLQDLVVPVWKRALGGCHPNRDIGPLPERLAGLQPVSIENFSSTLPFIVRPHIRGVWQKA